MQKLHLVGFTPDLDGLILSTRKGAKSGSFVVGVDASLLQQLADSKRLPEPAVRTNGVRPGAHDPRQSRPDSQLGPREMQELLRGGWTLEEVAVEAGVDVDWVSRFAAPVLAEMRLVLDQARECVFDKPRVGPSALTLAASVRRNVAERGVRFTDEDFEDAWRAYQLDDALWIVAFDYRSRGKVQSGEWTIDVETGELTSRGRLGTQLGHVQSARRKVNLTPPPKPKPKSAATRAVVHAPVEERRPHAAPAAPAARTAHKPAPSRPRARSSSGAAKATKAKAKKPAPKKGAAKPHAVEQAAGPRVDPYREELRRRAAEHAVAAPPPPPPAVEPEPPVRVASTAPPRVERPPRDEMRPVAIVGPTVRMLGRRPARPAPAPPPTARTTRVSRTPQPSEPTTGPVPAVKGDDEPWPDLQWSPGATHGPLPVPGPLPVSETIRERVATPLGTVEDDEELGADTWFPPPRSAAPVFHGARAAGEPTARRRRSEPLRGR